MESLAPDVLQEYEVTYVPASTGKRFLNMILDIIVIYVLYFIGILIFALLNPEAAQEYAADVEAGRSLLSQYLTAYMVYIGYYTLTEGFFKGKSVAKFITSTRVINNDATGSYISFQKALLRSLCRIVPFEAFSTFGGNPWHDRWTDTMVIDEKQTIRN